MAAFAILKCSRPSFPVGFSTSQTWRLSWPLSWRFAPSFLAFPPIDMAVLDAVGAHETRNCTHCALRTRLVGRRSFHNGNIVAQPPAEEPCCVGPGICQTRHGWNLRG